LKRSYGAHVTLSSPFLAGLIQHKVLSKLFVNHYFSPFTMDIEYEDNIWIAASDGNVEKVLHFIGSSPTVDIPDENGYTPLMAASSYGKLDLVSELLKRGANPNLQDNDGNTSLHHCDYASVLRVLLAAEGDVSVKNADGETALEVKKQEFEDEVEEEETPTQKEQEENHTSPRVETRNPSPRPTL
jgi:hypothetical protein